MLHGMQHRSIHPMTLLKCTRLEAPKIIVCKCVDALLLHGVYTQQVNKKQTQRIISPFNVFCLSELPTLCLPEQIKTFSDLE